MKLVELHRKLKEEGVATFGRTYLSNLVAKGKIPYTGEGKRKQFDYDEVVAALKNNAERTSNSFLNDLAPPKEGQSPEEYGEEIVTKMGKDPSLTESKVFLTIYQGKLAQQKYLIEKGDLISREDVERAAFMAVRVLRDHILALPERLAGEIASSTDPMEIKEIMYKEINSALKYLSDEKALYEQ